MYLFLFISSSPFGATRGPEKIVYSLTLERGNTYGEREFKKKRKETVNNWEVSTPTWIWPTSRLAYSLLKFSKRRNETKDFRGQPKKKEEGSISLPLTPWYLCQKQGAAAGSPSSNRRSSEDWDNFSFKWYKSLGWRSGHHFQESALYWSNSIESYRGSMITGWIDRIH